MGKLGLYIEEVNEKTTQNNQYEVLTSSQGGIVSQEDYFNKQVASTDNTGYKVIRKGQFTYRSMSDTGRFYINRLTNREVGIVSPAYPVFKIASDKIMPEYLSLFFQSEYFQGQISNKASGSTRLALRYSKLENVEIDITAKEKQEEIVKNIDFIKKVIEVEEKEQSILDELIKSRFNEMFVNHNYFKTSIRSLVEITKVSAKKRYSGTDKFEYIDISSIDNSSHEVISSTTYTISNAPSRAQQCLKTNDILVSTVRPNLKNIALFRGNNDGFVGSSGFCVLRANNCNPAYLLYNVLTDEFTGSMVRLTTGASYPAVRDDDVLDYQIYDAPIHLQNKFANFVEQVDKLKFNVQQRIEKYKELLDKKMSEYFN